MSKSPTRAAVEEAVTTLAQKVITAADNNSAADAARYAEGLRDAAAGLEYVSDAEEDDDVG